MALVSTIIPAFNAEPYVRDAIESALAQTYSDQEIIVIDDGSTDKTAAILEEYKGCIRTLRQNNRGLADARNRGAREARGDWLAFLDADDLWLPEKLDKQLAQNTHDEAALLYTDRINIGCTGHTCERLSDALTLYEGDVFNHLLCGNFLTASSVLMRKDWFERLGGFDGNAWGCEDWDLWLRYSAEGGWFRVAREPLTKYRIHADSMSHNFDRMCKSRFHVIHKTLSMTRGEKVPWSTTRRAIAKAWEVSAWEASRTDRWKAARWYLRSAWYNPVNMDSYKGFIKCCLGMS